MSTECVIQANPDISGIGVRIAVYVQSIIAIVPGALTLISIGIDSSTRPSPSSDSLDAQVEALSATALGILFTGTALLLSLIIQAKTYGLTVYHALIVLNMSWLNNVSAVGPLLTGWTYDSIRQRRDRRLQRFKEGIAYLAHFTATGGIGLWVFSDLAHFGAQSECTPSTVYWVFGREVAVTNGKFRKFWLVIYSIAVIPFINYYFLLLLMIPIILACYALSVFASFVLHRVQGIDTKWARYQTVLSKYYRGLWPIGSIFLAVVLILTTEETIAHNRVTEEESQWTFGQTLALLVVFLPARGAWKQLQAAWSRRVGRKGDAGYAAAAPAAVMSKVPPGSENRILATGFQVQTAYPTVREETRVGTRPLS